MTHLKKRLNLRIFLYGTLLIIVGCGPEKDNDGKTFKTIKIGNQTWMAENLSVTHYQNGDSIPNIKLDTDWKKQTSGAYCDFNNNSDTGNVYGHLYNYYAVNEKRNIAPKGWHVARKEDWDTLISYLKLDSAGIKLREAGTKHWKCIGCPGPCFFGTNQSGFTALPASYRGDNGPFPDGAGSVIGNGTSWWCVSDSCKSPDTALYWGIGTCYKEISKQCWSQKQGLSVRCVKD